jgi:hypothetical protein
MARTAGRLDVPEPQLGLKGGEMHYTADGHHVITCACSAVKVVADGQGKLPAVPSRLLTLSGSQRLLVLLKLPE